MQSLRIATEKDVDFICCLTENLFDASVYSKHTTFNMQEVKALAKKILQGKREDAIVLILGDEEKDYGIAVCSHMNQLFNSKEKTAVELAFWIEPEHRTRSGLKTLLSGYKFWAKKIGCGSILYGKMKTREAPEEYIMRRL